MGGLAHSLKEESPGVWKLTGKPEILVTRESATDVCTPGPRQDKLALNHTHSDLPKFSRPWDNNYRLIEFFLDEFRREAVWAVQARFGKDGTDVYLPPMRAID